MSWPEGWPYTNEQVNRLILAFPPNRVFANLATEILQVYEKTLREFDAFLIARGRFTRNFVGLHFPPNRLVYRLAVCEAADLPIPWNRRHLSARRFMALSGQDKYAILQGATRLGALLRYLRKSANGIAPLIGGGAVPFLRRNAVSNLERFRQMQEVGDWFVSGREDRVLAMGMGLAGASIGITGFANRMGRFVGEVRQTRAARLARAAAANPDPEHPGANAGPGPYPEGDQSAGGRSPRPAGTDPGSPETPRATRSRTAPGELEEMVNESRYPRILPWEEALAWGQRLIDRSPWLRSLRDLLRVPKESQPDRLMQFSEQYESNTGITIEWISETEARILSRPGLELEGSNWGSYDEAGRTIYMRERVWEVEGVNPAEQVAHEVGAAELRRLDAIPKDLIPRVQSGTHPSLTHVIDMLLESGPSGP